MRQRLKLRSCRKAGIVVKTFGGTEHELKQLSIALVKIQGISSKYFHRIKALIFPTICSPPTNQVIDLARNSYSHLHNLELADSNTTNKLNADILIGANYIWDFMIGNIRRGESGPVAIQTTL